MTSVLDSLIVPPEWLLVPFGRLVERRKEACRPDLPPLSVFLDEGVVPRSSRHDNFNRLGSDLSKYLVVHPGDVVFNKLRTWQGGLGVSRHEGLVSPAYFVCRPVRGVVPGFLHYLLRSATYLAELTRISKFMPPSQFDISWDDLRLVPILIPEFGTQRAISDYLDAETVRIDTLISKKRRLIELLQERWDVWVRNQLASLPNPTRPLKRHWRVIDCKHRTPTYVEEGYPVVSPGDATPGRLDLRRAHRFVDESDYNDLASGYRQPKRGDIVYSRNASIGIASYVDTDEPFCMGQDVCLIQSNDMDQLFLMYALNSIGLDQLETQKIGSTFDRVNISQILEIRVPVPDPSEQQELGRRFDLAASRRSRAQEILEQQINLLKDYRTALITAAVTGQISVES